MSYCVHCGVELDPSLSRCPLCKTPVINPNHREAVAVPTTYPQENVSVVMRKMRRMTALLLTVIFSIPMLVCPLCDFIINGRLTWSCYVIISIAFAWLVSVPPIVLRHNTLLKCTWIDYFSCNILLIVLNILSLPEQNWYVALGLPITSFIAFVVLMFIFLFRKFDIRPLTVISLSLLMSGILSVWIECLLISYNQTENTLIWSIPVFISCTAVSILLFIISRMTHLQALIRRKMHL